MDSPVAGRVEEKAGKDRVTFAACAITMKKTKVIKDDLTFSAVVVPGGVVEIMRRQSEGWAYIKP